MSIASSWTVGPAPIFLTVGAGIWWRRLQSKKIVDSEMYFVLVGFLAGVTSVIAYYVFGGLGLGWTLLISQGLGFFAFVAIIRPLIRAKPEGSTDIFYTVKTITDHKLVKVLGLSTLWGFGPNLLFYLMGEKNLLSECTIGKCRGFESLYGSKIAGFSMIYLTSLITGFFVLLAFLSWCELFRRNIPLKRK
jgi:hypothetical protein